MHHLQRAWECSILPLFIPSVNLMHRQSYENRLLAHLHNFKISSSRNKETNEQFFEMSKQAISKKQEMKQKIKHLCVFDRVATAIGNENTNSLHEYMQQHKSSSSSLTFHFVLSLFHCAFLPL